MTASTEELSRWLGLESGAHEAVHVAQENDEDLLKDLRRGLNQVRAQRKK